MSDDPSVFPKLELSITSVKQSDGTLCCSLSLALNGGAVGPNGMLNLVSLWTDSDVFYMGSQRYDEVRRICDDEMDSFVSDWLAANTSEKISDALTWNIDAGPIPVADMIAGLTEKLPSPQEGTTTADKWNRHYKFTAGRWATYAP